MPVIAEIGRSKSLERLECGHGVLTPRGGRVVQFTVRATSFVFKMTVVVAVVLFALVLVMVLPLLLTDAYSQVSWPLLYGAIFAFLSQLSSLGKGLQKAGVQSLPELSLRRAVLWQYASSHTWRAGFILDMCGALFGLAALSILPISIAQPIFCNGLVLLALYSHFWLDEQLGRREWVCIALCFSGTVLLAVTLVPRDWGHTDIRWIQVKLGLAMLVALPVLTALEICGRSAKRHPTDSSPIELLAGLQAGLCIGVGNAAIATGLQSMSRSWRAHLLRRDFAAPDGLAQLDHLAQQDDPLDQSASGRMAAHLVLSSIFVLSGVLLNGAHPIFANRGYRHGRVVLISTYTSLASMATGVFIGIAVLDESWPTAPRLSLLRQLSFLLIFWGVLTLNGHRISASLSRPTRISSSHLSPAASSSQTDLPHAGTPRGSPGHKRHLSDGAPPAAQLQQLHSPLGPQAGVGKGQQRKVAGREAAREACG